MLFSSDQCRNKKNTALHLSSLRYGRPWHWLPKRLSSREILSSSLLFFVVPRHSSSSNSLCFTSLSRSLRACFSMGTMFLIILTQTLLFLNFRGGKCAVSRRTEFWREVRIYGHADVRLSIFPREDQIDTQRVINTTLVRSLRGEEWP